MRTKLQKYFPMIKTRQAILDEIDGNTKMHSVFYSWEKKQKEEFLDFCTGVKGVKLLYDSFFKQIMNPETAPRRLEEFISAAIGEKVKILHVLPNESARIAAEDSLLIMDMVVQLTDGSLANVEIQKLGYRFSGQRSACYSADLLLRQYKRLREEKGKSFTYKDVKNVYTIVLFEKSEKKYQSRFISIIWSRKAIPESRQICFRNTRLYALTSSGMSFKIKMERLRIIWKNGYYF